MAVSPTYRAEAYGQNSGAAEINLIRIELAAKTLYRAAWPTAVVSQGITYQPSNFTIPLPGNPGGQPSVTLTIETTDADNLAWIREEAAPVYVAHEVVLASDPDAVEIGPIDYEVRDVSWQGARASVELGFEPILNEPAPYGRTTPTTTPGLFT